MNSPDAMPTEFIPQPIRNVVDIEALFHLIRSTQSFHFQHGFLLIDVRPYLAVFVFIIALIAMLLFAVGKQSLLREQRVLDDGVNLCACFGKNSCHRDGFTRGKLSIEALPYVWRCVWSEMGYGDVSDDPRRSGRPGTDHAGPTRHA